jgi:cell division protein FtsB
MMRPMRRQVTHRRRPRGWLRAARQVVAVGLLCGGLVLAAAFVGITAQGNALAHEIASLRGDIAAEQGRGAQLEATIQEQRTADYVRQQARDYGIVGPNEALVQVQRDGQAGAPSTVVAPTGTTRVQRWITYFFGVR